LNVLFDLVHPAQVHFFKNAIAILITRGDKVMVTAREKDVTVALLKSLNIDHICISTKGSSLLAMGFELITRSYKLYKIAKAFRPDVMVARVGVSVGPVGKIMGIPTVVYDDMEHAKLQGSIGMTFATYICTGLGYYKDFGKRHIRFAGSPVMSYMSSKYFTPDKAPLLQAGLDPDAPYIFMRTVSWDANHDVGRGGSSPQELINAINTLRQFGRVVISSEERLPAELAQYENPVPVNQMHNLLAFAKLCIVEGGTMAAEAAVLGVPVICRKSYDFGYLRALETEYALIARPDTMDDIIKVASKWLANDQLSAEWKAKQKKLVDESDDVTQFQLDMISRAIK
jgi:predicted glycosyltransferase